MAVLINITADENLHLSLCLGLGCSLNKGVLTIELSAFFIDAKPNWWPKAFIEIPTQEIFYWSIPYIKFYSDGLEMLYMRSLVLYFVLLILGVLFNLTSDTKKNVVDSSKFIQKKFFNLYYVKSLALSYLIQVLYYC